MDTKMGIEAQVYSKFVHVFEYCTLNMEPPRSVCALWTLLQADILLFQTDRSIELHVLTTETALMRLTG